MCAHMIVDQAMNFLSETAKSIRQCDDAPANVFATHLRAALGVSPMQCDHVRYESTVTTRGTSGGELSSRPIAQEWPRQRAKGASGERREA